MCIIMYILHIRVVLTMFSRRCRERRENHGWSGERIEKKSNMSIFGDSILFHVCLSIFAFGDNLLIINISEFATKMVDMVSKPEFWYLLETQ